MPLFRSGPGPVGDETLQKARLAGVRMASCKCSVFDIAYVVFSPCSEIVGFFANSWRIGG
jgi:hypothetical protein